jgi:subtilisin family serine protease
MARGMNFGPRSRDPVVCAFLSVAFLLFLPPAAAAFPLRPSLAKLSGQDTLCRVWVIFTDKNGSARTTSLSPRAFERRRRAGAGGIADADIAVSPRYLAELRNLGCRVGQIFKWANAASVTVHASRLSDLAASAHVKDLIGVRSYRSVVAKPSSTGLAKKAGYDSSSLYGVSYGQMAMLNVPAVHQHVASALSSAPGTDVTIGLFDTGFRTKHACFSLFNAGNHLLADSDFIDNDGTVADPDSVANDPSNPYYHNDEHGSMTLSLIAGYDPPRFAGVAWGARFILARTEDSKEIATGEIEKHYEEDNWAAAMVWAESLGVDIVSSSLGYRDGFTPPDTDYTYNDMNGRTTIISKAARQAVHFGVLVVNAMGNDGPDPGSLDAPADVDSVISVGAVDGSQAIAFFSSRGPTSDGRIKPDCVAQGYYDAVPLIYGSDSISYWYGDGTSFSTPLVAGVCALIKQTHPNEPAAATRGRLLTSCAFVPGQTAVDNTYGRGVPNAKIACVPPALPAPQVVVFPNVISIRKKPQRLNLEFIGLADSLLFSAAIRSIDGMLVWTAQVTAKNTVVVLPWPQEGATVAPGVYYFIINYAGKTYRQKFFVTG